MRGAAELMLMDLPAKAISCSFTVDVEDWYQSSVDFNAPITERVLYNVEKVTTLLDECGVKGTFFIQGLVAKKFPGLVRDLLKEGHEIQSHGHTHRPLYGMSRPELMSELESARKSVEDVSGVRITSFRAPDFSILSSNLWALEVLAECGFEVDSSIFPKPMSRYGIPGWTSYPRSVHLPDGRTILEAPVAVWESPYGQIPVAGGGYFRLLPECLLVRAIDSMCRQKRPVILYCHPYEFSPEELDGYRGKVSGRFRITQSLGRRFFRERMKSILQKFSCGRMDELLKPYNENCVLNH